MNAHLVGNLQFAKAYGSSVLVLVVLSSIGLWGHKTKWTLPGFARTANGEPHQDEASERSDKAVVKQSETKAEADPPAPARAGSAAGLDDVVHTGEAEVRFETVRAMHKSGIQVTTVALRPMDQEIVVIGSVTYDQTRVAQLSSRVPGTVWRVEKHVGQAISKGDVLAIIEASEVGKAKANFLQAVVIRDLKEKTLVRLRSLDAVLSKRTVEEAEAALHEARIELYNSQQTLVNLGLPISLEDIAGLNENDLARRVQFLGLPKSIVDTLDPSTTTGNLIPLVAPFDGLVIGHDVTLGELVSSAKPQFVIADTSRMWIHLDVNREHASQLDLGQDVVFSCDGAAGELQSTISWISTEVDAKTRLVGVRAEIENPLTPGASSPSQRLLRAHAFGHGRIRLRERSVATVVPNKALQWDGGSHVVFVKTSPITFQARAVKTGSVGEEFTEVISGLTPGEIVVREGSHVLKAELLRSRMAAN